MRHEPKRPTRSVVAAGVGAVLLVGWFLLPQKPPQIGTAEDVFRAVDATFTAVTARDERLLSECSDRLRAQRDAGLLSADASNYLGAIIEQARGGGWEPAAERLYHFMKAQRRQPRKSAAASGES